MRLADSPRALQATAAAAKVTGRYSTRLGGFFASQLWFTPWRVPVSDRGLKKQAGWLSTTQRFILNTSAGRIAGFSAGDGPLVILVHGWGETAAGLGGFIAPLTEAGYSVVGIDLRGHGDSGGQTTDVVESAAVIREVAEHFGGAHAVIAHSMGANSALWALKDGLDVNAAVLIAPNVDLAYAMETFEVLFGLPPKAIHGLKRSIERKFGTDIWQQIRGDHLARFVTAPGMVFHDPEDPQVPFMGSQRLVRAWDECELIEAPGLGHGAITRDPHVIVRAIGFVESRDPVRSRTA